MEKLIHKLKNTGLITFIIGILSLTWLFLDYLALKDVWVETGAEFSYRWIMIIVSGIILILFHLFVFLTLYYIFRLKIKYKSEQKALQKAKAKENNSVIQSQEKESHNK